jgi:hypothetical protein
MVRLFSCHKLQFFLDFSQARQMLQEISIIHLLLKAFFHYVFTHLCFSKISTKIVDLVVVIYNNSDLCILCPHYIVH